MRNKLFSLLAVGALALGACGGDDSGDTRTTAEGDATTTTDARSAGTTDVDAGGDPTPERIVSLSPTATEMLFAIGAGDQVVAVDDQSDFPPEAPTTDLSGFEPNAEAIASYEPDLVVVDRPTIEPEMDELGIELLVLPAVTTIEDAYAQIEQLGEATGHVDEAESLVAEMQAEIDEILDRLPDDAEPLTYYHELDDTYFTVTSSTFIGDVYARAGLVNIADEADADGSGYPQISAEYIIEQDPDIIFLADAECCGQDAQTVAARPGWDQITAVREGRVVELDEDVASRWGPRVVEFLRVVVDAVEDVRAA